MDAVNSTKKTLLASFGLPYSHGRTRSGILSREEMVLLAVR